MVAMTKEKVRDVSKRTLPLSFSDIFVSKRTYQHVATDFHVYHRHDLNCFAHLLTTTLGVWGVVQLVTEALPTYEAASFLTLSWPVLLYAVLVVATTPLTTGLSHTVLLTVCAMITPAHVFEYFNISSSVIGVSLQESHLCVAAIVAGYGLQDLAHYLACEPTFMQSYLTAGQPHMLLIHSFWLLPLVLDAMAHRHWFLPYVPSRNRVLVCTTVEARGAVDTLRTWIHTHVPPTTAETTHVWPHTASPETAQATVALEQDKAIRHAFAKLFAPHHYDVEPVASMNEIYVTAVGAKRSINSDAVFYSPHTDGPYWWLPGASLYRVLVGVTPNQMVQTKFVLQHVTQDQVLDQHGVLGFDYNRELHWIDHVPGVVNAERRSLLKLHFVVYPKGWHRYGQLCARWNAAYNTWARGNFLTTLRPSGLYQIAMAWWIWITTWSNALLVQHLGWSNLAYVGLTYMLGGPTIFLLATSFRHYLVYVTTFAYRTPAVAHGVLMRDAKFYKTVSMMHLARRLLPLVQSQPSSRTVPTLAVACIGFGVTLVATARLGMVRTYFGTELGFVQPAWIEGFPYGTLPHPMIGGQIFGLGVILCSFWKELDVANAALLSAHIGCYVFHMVQEMLYSAY